MFAGTGFDSLRAQFAEQFEPDGAGFLYRKFSRSAPVRVTAEERQRFIAAYERFTKFAWWGLIAGSILLIAALASVTAETPNDISKYGDYAAPAILVAIFLIINHLAYSAPARALRERMPVGEPRSRTEMQQRGLQKLTYGHAIIIGGVAIYCLFKAENQGVLFSKENAFWIAMAAFSLVVSVFIAIRKWRFDSAKKP